MKRKYIPLLAIALTTVVASSCIDDEFLDRFPKDKETAATVFTTYNNFKMYAWGLYNGESSYPGLTAYQNYPQAGDVSDMLFSSTSAQGSGWVNGTISNISYSWNFVQIRKVNVMLDAIDGSRMSTEEKNHWRGVGYFFRAYAYFDLLKKYGDLPWLEHEVKTGDTDILYGPRDSREVVANNMLENLKYAVENIRAAGDGANTINPNVVRALISRFGLFEGTWRKYHGSVDGVDGTKYFTASVEASQNLIDQNLGLMDNYDAVFNSLSLKGQKSILLYREYTNAGTAYGHDLTQRTRGERLYEGSKKLVRHYLCADGRPVTTSAVYEGDDTMFDEFRNRDYRLYFTICPPYNVDTPTDFSSWTHTGDPADREYIDLMAGIAGNAQGKILPVKENTNKVIPSQPNIYVVHSHASSTQAGYFMYKYYNNLEKWNELNLNSTDGPVFRMGEVLVNHAEAKFELGAFNQTVADATINKLRARAGVAAMAVSAINAGFDAERDDDVDPVLWEIRRERTVELMGSGFRFEDIKRWKKGEYMSEQPAGVKILNPQDYENGDVLAGMMYQGTNANYENCVTYINKPSVGWENKCYLYPIHLSQLTLNSSLVQNPGW